MATTDNPNGNGHADLSDGTMLPQIMQELRALETSIILQRASFFQQHGIAFNDKRDLYSLLGYPRQLTVNDYRALYARGGIAGRIVDALPNACWRGEFELIEDEDPNKNTQFEQAWQDLDQRLQIQAKLLRVDKLSQLSTYAVLLLGAKGTLDQELPRATSPDQLLYLSPFLGSGGPGGSGGFTTAGEADVTIKDYVTDSRDPRFGLPLTYQLRRTDISSPDFQKPVHWTRVIHIADGLLSDDVFGLPSLERVFNLLMDLEKVTGGGAEAFWLRANQGLHLDIDKDMALDATKDTIESLKEQAEAYQHQLTRWLRTRGVNVETLGSDVANFANPADAILTQIAGAKAIPKRILTGSEMGELASSQDRDNWVDQIHGRQTEYCAPYVIRPLVDRLIAYGYLPSPKKDVRGYEVRWPRQQTLTEAERSAGAQSWASTNSAQKEPVFTVAEIRDHWYQMPPLSDEQLEEIRAQKQENMEQAAEAAQAMAKATGKVGGEEEGNGKVLPFQRRAAEEANSELVEILAAAIEADNEPVVSAILGVSHRAAREYVRDERGQFAETGASSANAGERRRYVKASTERAQFQHNPADAVHSLLNNEDVDVDPHDVRGVLERAAKQGEDPDLARLTVNGQAIFSKNNLGIRREEMPQVPKEMRTNFLAEAEEAGIGLTKEMVSPLDVFPTQSQISARRSGVMLGKYDKDPTRKFPPLLVSKSGHVLDGHHHWAMMASVALTSRGVRMPIYRLDMNTEDALKRMHDYDRRHGIKRESMTDIRLPRAAESIDRSVPLEELEPWISDLDDETPTSESEKKDPTREEEE